MATHLVDDAAIFPPGDAPLHDAAAAHVARRGRVVGRPRGLVRGPRHRRAAAAAARPARLSVVVTGGAGQLAGPAGLCRRLGLELAGLEIALRDLDDLTGNARRVVAAVDAARSEGALDEDVAGVRRAAAGRPVVADWLRGGRRGGPGRAPAQVPHRRARAPTCSPPRRSLAAWIDAALDRETPFKCTAGMHRALRHRDPATGFEHHGFLNVLTATRRAFDGDATHEVAAILDEPDDAAADRARPRHRPGRGPALVHLVRLLLRRGAARDPGRDRTAGGPLTHHLGRGRRRLAVRRRPPAVRRVRPRRRAAPGRGADRRPGASTSPGRGGRPAGRPAPLRAPVAQRRSSAPVRPVWRDDPRLGDRAAHRPDRARPRGAAPGAAGRRRRC